MSVSGSHLEHGVGRLVGSIEGLAILVTGVPGSGKSTIAAALRLGGHAAYDIEALPGMFSMVSKTTGKAASWVDNGDLEALRRYDWVCDVRKLKRLVEKNRRTDAFYSGVASNMPEVAPVFDRVLLLVPTHKVLSDRLATRKTNSFGNDPEVRKWVLGWKSWFEDGMKGMGAIPIKATGSVRAVVSRVLKAGLSRC